MSVKYKVMATVQLHISLRKHFIYWIIFILLHVITANVSASKPKQLVIQIKLVAAAFETLTMVL